MKLRLTILWLLVGVVIWAQPEFTLKSGEQLSHLNQYGRSTQELEAFIRANPNRLYDQSQALLLISYNHMQLGDYANALAANEASLNIKAQLHADDLVNNYVRSGAIHLLRGNYHTALSYLLKAKDFPIEAIQLYSIIDSYLAAAYRGLRQFEQAETYYRQSIETLLIEYPGDHPNIITSYFNLGELYVEWGKPEQARRYFQLGLERSKTSSEQAFLQALLNNGLGKTYQEQAPQLAERHHRNALDIATEFFGGYHRETAQASLLLAKAIYRQNRRDEARDAIQLAIRSLNPEQPNLSWAQIPDTARLIIDRPLLAEALGFKARWLMDAALPDEQRLPLALANSEAAAQLLRVAMDDQIDQEDRLELLRIAREAFAGGIEAGIELAASGKDKHAKWRAFQLIESAKILQFRAHTGHVLQLTGAFADRERAMLRTLRLAEMKFRLQPLDLTVSQELYRLRENYRRLKEDWKRTEPLNYQQRFGMNRNTLQQVAQNLEPDQVVFTYFTGPEYTWLFAVDRENLEVYTLDPKGLSAQVNRFLAAIDTNDAAQIAELGYQLYAKLMEPAATKLKKNNIVSIIPDQPFESLPFDALLTKPYRNKRPRLSKFPYLIKDLAVQYRYTVTCWETAVPANSEYEFLFLSPVFDQEWISRIPVNRRIFFDANIHANSPLTEGNYFKPLTEVPSEVSQLQVIWGQSGQEGRFKMREAATESYLSHEMGKAHYMHLGTYAFVKGASPEETGLVLASPDPNGSIQNDGFLLGSELALQNTSATELISIEFTEADEVEDRESTNILPLSGSLLLTGISNLIYTTHQPDEAAFYPAFYELLLAEGSIAESMRQTKISLFKQKDTAAPRSWAYYRLLSR